VLQIVSSSSCFATLRYSLESKVGIKQWTVIVDHKDTGALNEAGCSNTEQGTLPQRRFPENVQPAGRQRTINGQLLGDLNVLSPGKRVIGIFRIVMKTEQDLLRFLVAALQNQPAC
jgi:hypothetical protein